MTIELVIGSIASLGALGSFALGGGILSRYIKHSNELAVTKYRLEQTEQQVKELIDDVKTLKSDSVEISTRVEQFAEHIKKLDLIPDLAAKLASTQELVSNVQRLVIAISQSHTIQAS